MRLLQVVQNHFGKSAIKLTLFAYQLYERFLFFHCPFDRCFAKVNLSKTESRHRCNNQIKTFLYMSDFVFSACQSNFSASHLSPTDHHAVCEHFAGNLRTSLNQSERVALCLLFQRNVFNNFTRASGNFLCSKGNVYQRGNQINLNVKLVGKEGTGGFVVTIWIVKRITESIENIFQFRFQCIAAFLWEVSRHVQILIFLLAIFDKRILIYASSFCLNLVFPYWLVMKGNREMFAFFVFQPRSKCIATFS